MKLPKSNEKFAVTGKKSPFYGNVVSGVHLEVRADDEVPDKLWYYVCVDRVYEGDIISRYGCYLYGSFTLEGAFDCIAQYLTPYQEQEEKADEGPAAEAVDSDDPKVVSENMVLRSGIDDNDSPGSAGRLCGSGSICDISSGIPDKISRDCVIPEVTAALNHMFDSFNSLAADLLHLQYILTPALPAKGGAAHA